jgi:hypothetical protein
MFCENDECCACYKEIPVTAFGAADISEGVQFIPCPGRPGVSLGVNREHDNHDFQNFSYSIS